MRKNSDYEGNFGGAKCTCKSGFSGEGKEACNDVKQ
jgi:hypothetical protein